METQTIDTAAKANKTPPPFADRIKEREAPFYEGGYYEDGKLKMIFFVNADPAKVATIAQDKLQKGTPEYQELVAAYMTAENSAMSEKEIEKFIDTAIARPRTRLYGSYDRWLDSNQCRFGDKPPTCLTL